MLAKVSGDYDCLRFAQITGRYLQSLASNLCEAFFCEQGWHFSKLVTYFLSGTTKRDQTKHLLFFEDNSKSSVIAFVPKNWNVHCWLFNPLSRKHTGTVKKILLRQNWPRTYCCNFFQNYRVKKMLSKTDAKLKFVKIRLGSIVYFKRDVLILIWWKSLVSRYK